MAARQAGKGKRGGARHDRNRLSYVITERQCRDLFDAVDVASRLGRPFNRWITIAWGRNGIDSRDNRKLTGQWIKLAGDWLRRRGERLVWAYVQEASDRNGAHVHILLHVPPLFDPIWRPFPSRWITQLLGKRPQRDTLQCQRIAAGDGTMAGDAAYDAAVLGKAHYMLKAAPKALETALGVEWVGRKPWGVPCAVYGVRLSIWQGWKRDAHCMELRDRARGGVESGATGRTPAR